MAKIYKALFLFSLTALLVTSSQATFGQKTCSAKVDFSTDIVSRYIWRGLNLGGSSPSIQPCLNLQAGSFEAGVWGAYSFNHAITSQECDLYLSYNIADKLTLMVTDYFFPAEDAVNNYFEYRKESTGHIVEIGLQYPGTEKLPLSLSVSTNVYGADARKANGKLQYSTYIEAAYTFKVSETECNIFAGGTPNKPNTEKEETGFYADRPAFINVGFKASKTLKITDSFSLPVNASFITNPEAGNVFLVVGISL